MKDRRHTPIKVLNEELLQARIDKEVAKLERRLRAYNYEVGNNNMAKLWRYLRSLGRGITYLDTADFIRDSGTCKYLNSIDLHWLASSRTHILEQRGWLKCIGRAAPSPYFKDPTAKGARGAKLYEPCVPERRNLRGIQRACDKLVANVELWDAQTNQVPSCIVEHLNPERIYSNRDWDIVDDRVCGLTLQEIGDKHGITRERVRQIIDKAVGRKMWYERKQKPS